MGRDPLTPEQAREGAEKLRAGALRWMRERRNNPKTTPYADMLIAAMLDAELE